MALGQEATRDGWIWGLWKRLVKGRCASSWLGAVGAEVLGYNVLCVFKVGVRDVDIATLARIYCQIWCTTPGR